MILKNGLVFTSEGRFRAADIEIKGDRIMRVAPCGQLSGDEVLDVSGKYITPGFVDIHIHGAGGCDFCDAKAAAIDKIAEYLGSQGVTSFCAATMAYSEEILTDILNVARPVFNQDKAGHSVLRGVNMEGPFFSKAKKGAQNEDYIVDPNIDMFNRLYDVSGGFIKLVDVAPELSGAMDFIKNASEKCTVSIAHTTANYDISKEAFTNGASHVTHLFNAMPAFTHRDPGVVGAAADYASHVEIISDGVHLHPSVVRSVFEWFGDDRICLISDSMSACGMPNGEYSLGGQKVFMTDGKAVLTDGTIAGSATCLAECMRRAVSFGVPVESALKAATVNPAKAAGIYDEVGSIEVGKRADLLILDANLNPVKIIIGGK